MRYATEATPRLWWFNFANLFSMSLLPALYRLDGREQIGAATGRLLCGSLLPRERNVHMSNSGAH
jgi:uncharacterized membrane protein